MIPIELKKRYPHSRVEDITDAFMRGYQANADCSTCKHKDKDWDSEECDSCCGNNNHYASADAESDDLIIKGAKGIQDGLYNIKDGKLFKYKGKGGTVRTYPIVPSAEAVQGWIPCSERLPEDGQGVIVTVDDNVYKIKVGSCIYSNGRFHSLYNDLTVTAWMPLPKPYKGGAE